MSRYFTSFFLFSLSDNSSHWRISNFSCSRLEHRRLSDAHFIATACSNTFGMQAFSWRQWRLHILHWCVFSHWKLLLTILVRKNILATLLVRDMQQPLLARLANQLVQIIQAKPSTSPERTVGLVYRICRPAQFGNFPSKQSQLLC